MATATAVPQRESAWEELDLIKAARHALREARATGGNRVLRANLGMAGPPELVDAIVGDRRRGLASYAPPA